MNADENRDGSRGLNHQISDGKAGEDKYDRIQGQAKGHPEYKVNGTAEDTRNGNTGVVQGSAGLQISEPQHQTSSSVCWERFLHVRSIRVLLVENDDSTRHVVAALLRNCSYEVVEAANGLQAWKTLEDLNNHIDIVLTELVMPYISGIGLLCKILSHKTRRNIPVIMMSSHDSMGLVFKCLSKGAVDFLVKPIRKNELKNLWQHVWRRCHSSSGSGSESGTQTQKSVKSKSVGKSDNDLRSNDEDENESTGLNIGYGSSDGSGTQSSWTKQAVEVDSPQPVSQRDRVDSTCAQVIHSNAEVPSYQMVAAPPEKDPQELEDPTVCRDLEISFPVNIKPKREPKDEAPIKIADNTRQDNPHGKSYSKWKTKVGTGPMDLSSENPSSKLMHEDGGSGFVTKSNHVDNGDSVAPNTHCKVLDTSETAVNNSEEQMHMEHGSKRHRGDKDDEMKIKDDRNVLRRSESSAFSRYNPASNANKLSSGNMGSNSVHDNGQDVTTKRGVACDCHSNLNDSLPNHYSHVSSNNIDMSSTTDNALVRPGVPKINSAVSSSVKHSSFQPCSSAQVLPHHCSHNHRVLNTHQKLPNHGSSNVYSEAAEGNAVNYSVNGSVSGSNHGSNCPNGGSTAVNAGVNMESDNNAGKSSSGDANGSGSGSGSGSRSDENKMSQREAALTKFRQKRKERCFRKKVRYQSRKRLAEQRPRVRGQFVRKTAATDDEDTSKPEDS